MKSWQQLLDTSRFKSPFQTKEFYDLFNAVEDFKAEVVAVETNGKLSGLCVATIQKESGVKGFFSKRAIIYGGPIFTEDKDSASYLIKQLQAVLSDVIYIETRNFFDYSELARDFAGAGWKYEPYINFQLDCSGEETVWGNLNNNRQRQIKKAFKIGVQLTEAKTKEDVKDFYAVLKNLYTSKVKKPLFSEAFFQKWISAPIGKIILVRFENKVIGGIACSVNNKAIYELYICGLDQEYKECSPSVMATYAAIEYGFKNGLSYFDFMGAGRADENYGVRDFKEKFGGKLVEHGRFIHINNSMLYSLGKLGLKIISGKK